MSRLFKITAIALALAVAAPAPVMAQRWDRGGWHGDRGRHDGWRGRPGPGPGYGYGRPGPGYYGRRGSDVAPLVGGALLGLGLGAVLGGALAPAPGYAAPPPQYAPPPPAYYGGEKPY